MKRPGLKNGSAIIFTIAMAFVGLGIFLDGEVVPVTPSSKNLLNASAEKVSRDAGASLERASGQSSEIAQQLKKAIDAANRSESEETEGVTQNISASDEKISQINRLLEEKGVLPATDKNHEESEKFSRRLESLKARLAKLQLID